MQSAQAIRRFFSNAWLAAGPLILLFLLVVGVPTILGVVHAMAARLFGLEAADTFLMDAGMWVASLLFVFVPIGSAIYAIVCVAKWHVRKREQ